MRVPISYALHYPERADVPVKPLDLAELKQLTFEEPDEDTFACLRLAREAGQAGGTAPCVLNAANEIAVQAFLDGALPFTGIAEVIERALQAIPAEPVGHFSDLYKADARGARAGRRADRGGGRMSWAIAFAGFCALIILHELGHFTAAKAVGMRVERFTLFFPPLIARRRSARPSTRSASLPLGGYVKISGMSPAEDLPPEVRDRAYHAQPVWKRIVVIAAGPFVNLVLAFILLLVYFGVYGPLETTNRSARPRRAPRRPAC